MSDAAERITRFRMVFEQEELTVSWVDTRKVSRDVTQQLRADLLPESVVSELQAAGAIVAETTGYNNTPAVAADPYVMPVVL